MLPKNQFLLGHHCLDKHGSVSGSSEIVDILSLRFGEHIFTEQIN